MDKWKDNAMWQCPMPQGKTERERQLELELEQAKAENLRQEVASMNKECEYWQHYRIQASIAAMQAQLSSYNTMHSVIQRLKEKGINEKELFSTISNISVLYADALIAELKKGG